ncbi:hypothetical protein ACXDL9_002722 [Klebsiella pneumoniae]
MKKSSEYYWYRGHHIIVGELIKACQKNNTFVLQHSKKDPEAIFKYFVKLTGYKQQVVKGIFTQLKRQDLVSLFERDEKRFVEIKPNVLSVYEMYSHFYPLGCK